MSEVIDELAAYLQRRSQFLYRNQRRGLDIARCAGLEYGPRHPDDLWPCRTLPAIDGSWLSKTT
jgi:hypothetical protein